MNINSIKIATVTAGYVAAVWVLCSIAVVIAPDTLRYISGAMMHLDLSQWDWEMGMDTFVVGPCWNVGSGTGIKGVRADAEKAATGFRAQL
jgi:hypothetical protein